MMDSLLPFSIFAILNLTAVVSGIHSPPTPSTASHPSSLLAKSIIGGSTELKPPPEEVSSLFGVVQSNDVPEKEPIHVVKRDGSKEPLEGKKVCIGKLVAGYKTISSCSMCFLSTVHFGRGYRY
jgi:hypothetical protein